MTTAPDIDREVRERFPRPVAAAWHRVHLGLHPAERIEAVSNFAEVLTRYLCTLELPDYLYGAPNDDVEKTIGRLSRPSLGVWVSLLRQLSLALAARSDVFCPEAAQWGSQSHPMGPSELDALVVLRNQAAHGNLSRAERDELAGDIVAAGQQALRATRWLTQYRLVRWVRAETDAAGTPKHVLEICMGRGVRREFVSTSLRSHLDPASTYVVTPRGDRLQNLEPFLRVLDHPSAPEKSLYLFKHARELRSLTLVDEATGHGEEYLPRIGGTPVALRAWLEQRTALPNPVQEEPLGRVTLDSSSTADELAVGELISDRFEVQGLLGRGGMASVYACFDRTHHVSCAIKVMHAALSTDVEFRERFRREVRVLGGIHHPSIIPLEDAFSLPDGRLCLRMALVGGGPLADRIETAGQPAEQVTRWAVQLLAGLACLHERGIVHRDIKPSNLLLDDADNLLIADLGIVYLPRETRLTQTIAQMGTFAYLAPEQRRRGIAPAPAQDIYAAALVLHELLTGDLHTTEPGAGIAGPWGELLRQMGRADPAQRPSAEQALACLQGAEPFGPVGTVHVDDHAVPGPVPFREATKCTGLSTPATRSHATDTRFPRRAEKAKTWRRGSLVGVLLLAGVGVSASITAVFQAERCGDGVVDANEDCDDGNRIEGDLCSATCRSNLVTLPANLVQVGYSEDDLAAGMYAISPSRRPNAYLRERAAYSTPTMSVMLRSFQIMKTEVSEEAFADFLQRNGYGELEQSRRTPESIRFHKNLIDRVRIDPRRQLYPSRDTPFIPATVHLEEAVAYCAYTGGALPTEPQWEYAARGSGRGRVFPWGDTPVVGHTGSCDRFTGFFVTSEKPPEVVNCGDKYLSPVGSKPLGCTPEGICDLAGNADEFVIPGPVIWRAMPDAPADAPPQIYAGYPKPEDLDGELNTRLFMQERLLSPCNRESRDNPYGLRTGFVQDCVATLSGKSLARARQYPREQALLVVRGGNYDDSLPIFYQGRARFPHLDQRGARKGFRCAYSQDS